MRRAIVGYPKDPIRGSIRFLLHDKIDQLAVTIDPRAGFTQTEDFGLSNIPRSHVSQRPLSFVFKFDTAVAASGWGGCVLQSMASLNARFFIGRDNKIIVTQGFPSPNPLVQIKDPRGFWFEIRVPGPNPTSIAPGSNGVFAQPAPDRFPADGSDDSLFFRMSGDFIVSKLGKRKSEVLGQLAGKRLDRHNDFRGEKRRVSPAVAALGGQPGVSQRSVYAIWRRSVEAGQVVDRFACLRDPQRQGERFLLA